MIDDPQSEILRFTRMLEQTAELIERQRIRIRMLENQYLEEKSKADRGLRMLELKEAEIAGLRAEIKILKGEQLGQKKAK
jgi:hypothetical protein